MGKRTDPRRGPCPVCGRPMVGQKAYNSDRAGWRSRGFVQKKNGGKCHACFMREYRAAKAPGPLDDATVARLRAAVGLQTQKALVACRATSERAIPEPTEGQNHG